MHRILPLVLILALVGCSSSKESTTPDVRTTTTAQQQDRRQQVVENFQAIRERLALTDAQTEQVRPILAEQAEQMQAIREKYGFTGQRRQGQRQRMDRSQMQAMRADLETLRTQTNAKLSAVLTDVQMQEWQAIQAERTERPRRGGRRGGRG